MATYTVTGAGDCCCGVDPACPPRMLTLWNASTTLNVEITCDGDCSSCLQGGPLGGPECWPDTGTMPVGGTVREWESSGLACNTGGLMLVCNGGDVGLQFGTSACNNTIPTTLISLQNSPFMVVFTTSSRYFGYCGYDPDTGECTTEPTVTVTITEP